MAITSKDKKSIKMGEKMLEYDALIVEQIKKVYGDNKRLVDVPRRSPKLYQNIIKVAALRSMGIRKYLTQLGYVYCEVKVCLHPEEMRNEEHE